MLFSKLQCIGNRQSAGIAMNVFKHLRIRVLSYNLCEVFLRGAGSTATDFGKESVSTSGPRVVP